MKIFITTKKILVTIWLFTGVVIGHAYALEPPVVVYRADFREPAVIFANGFEPWGEDNELLRHVSGENSRSHTSGLVGTTSDFNAIRRLATELLIPTDRDDTLWIYSITPSREFYDVNGSLLHATMANQNSATIPGQALHLYSMFAWQEEFAALNGIRSTQIIEAISARRVVDEDGDASVVIDHEHVFANNHYIPSNPEINPGYLNATAVLDNFSVFFIGDLHRNPILASFDVEGCVGFKSGTLSSVSVCMEDDFFSMRIINYQRLLSIAN